MGKFRFVKSEKARLPLTDGDWVEIKQRLTVGETKRMQGQGFPSMTPANEFAESKFDVRWGAIEIARLEAYLLDWSFRDEHDKPVKLTRAAIEALDEATFEEVSAAITKFIEERDRPTLTPTGDASRPENSDSTSA